MQGGGGIVINDAMLKQAAEELAIAINESLPDPNVFFNSLQNLREK